ncbi:MAG: glutamine--tRNA ligase [Bacteroidetes bacterium 4572_117]|nr:MAG: glutamine--tRNA ligase [Bacteroidetes bacterium 4572_117]
MIAGTNENEVQKKPLNFIESIIEDDLSNNKHQQIYTRFPPEPNGYLHIGHAKSICLNFGLSENYKGKCNLRFDDTNPVKEDVEYVESIKEDIKWLGFNWEDEVKFTSNYFDKLYNFAIKLIKSGDAYVCELNAEQLRKYRGTPTEPGKESPWRNRDVAESLTLFEGMKNGDFDEGKYLLRAKIDMASPNMHMRDPILYRIRFANHHRTGNTWKIYPMYDFAHGQSDYFEGITHSVCTLEFEVHRPLYDWFIDKLADSEYRPQQIEFARLNLTYTVMSKRKLLELVESNFVNGWDDPRMPTISGFRRRGYTPESIRNFSDKIGVAKRDGFIDVALLEHSIREDLNKKADRVMGVLNPLKVIIDNYPEDSEEYLDAVNNPEDESRGKRKVPFSKELFIEQEDFMENPPRKFFRLGIGREVRLRYAYFIKCTHVEKDDAGNVTKVHCTYDPASKGGKSPDGRKVKGTMHWVSAKHAIRSEIRLYDRLFSVENPQADKEKDFKGFINENSLEVNKIAMLEPHLKTAKSGEQFQFERKGYFCVDKDSSLDNLIFNRTVTLRDSWAKIKNS